MYFILVWLGFKLYISFIVFILNKRKIKIIYVMFICLLILMLLIYGMLFMILVRFYVIVFLYLRRCVRNI